MRVLLYKNVLFGAVASTMLVAALIGCGDDDGGTTASQTSSSAVSSSSGSGGSGGSSSSTGGSAGGEAFLCGSVRDQALSPIDAVSAGEVAVLSDAGGVKEVYVDASAGGFQMASMNPYIYLDLDTAMRVEVTDPASFEDADWDIAIKRVAWRNNSADSGGGDGAAAFLPGAQFADVTMADASQALLQQEQWFDDDCNYELDAADNLLTTMGEWYDYDGATMSVTPKDGVFIVRGGDGVILFKLRIDAYYANPDGTSGMVSGRYVLRIATL